MTKEVRWCCGSYNSKKILKSCEDCPAQSECQGHTEYIGKFLPLIIGDL